MSADHVENPQQRWLPCLPAPGIAVRQSPWSAVAANWKNPKCRLEAVVAGRRDICAAAWNLLCLGWLRDYTGWPLIPKMTPHHATTSLNELLNQALFAWIPASVTHMLWNSFHTYFSHNFLSGIPQFCAKHIDQEGSPRVTPCLQKFAPLPPIRGSWGSMLATQRTGSTTSLQGKGGSSSL